MYILVYLSVKVNVLFQKNFQLDKEVEMKLSLLDEMMLLFSIIMIIALLFTALARFFFFASEYDEYNRKMWQTCRLIAIAIAIILMMFAGGIEFGIYLFVI